MKPARIPAPAKHTVRVKRCNRWDVYPQQEPIETCEVMARPRRENETPAQFAGRVVDALAAQHPKWKVASPVICGIEVAG